MAYEKKFPRLKEWQLLQNSIYPISIVKLSHFYQLYLVHLFHFPVIERIITNWQYTFTTLYDYKYVTSQ